MPWPSRRKRACRGSTLPGDLELVLLSPTPKKLERLRKKWRKVITDMERDYPEPGSAEDWLLRLEDDARYGPTMTATCWARTRRRTSRRCSR